MRATKKQIADALASIKEIRAELFDKHGATEFSSLELAVQIFSGLCASRRQAASTREAVALEQIARFIGGDELSSLLVSLQSIDHGLHDNDANSVGEVLSRMRP